MHGSKFLVRREKKAVFPSTDSMEWNVNVSGNSYFGFCERLTILIEMACANSVRAVSVNQHMLAENLTSMV